MEVILLEKMRNLGTLGEKVKVKPGYARNYLIPQGKAVYANADNIAKFEKRRAELEKVAADRHQKAIARQQTFTTLSTITITAKAGDEGKLFGSVGTRDISEALKKAGIDVEKRAIRLPQGALRTVGEHEVIIELDSDITATIKVAISPEG